MGESFEVGYRSVPEKSRSFNLIPMLSDFLTESKDLMEKAKDIPKTSGNIWKSVVANSVQNVLRNP